MISKFLGELGKREPSGGPATRLLFSLRNIEVSEAPKCGKLEIVILIPFHEMPSTCMGFHDVCGIPMFSRFPLFFVFWSFSKARMYFVSTAETCKDQDFMHCARIFTFVYPLETTKYILYLGTPHYSFTILLMKPKNSVFPGILPS